jgi:hypothetical protein
LDVFWEIVVHHLLAGLVGLVDVSREVLGHSTKDLLVIPHLHLYRLLSPKLRRFNFLNSHILVVHFLQASWHPRIKSIGFRLGLLISRWLALDMGSVLYSLSVCVFTSEEDVLRNLLLLVKVNLLPTISSRGLFVKEIVHLDLIIEFIPLYLVHNWAQIKGVHTVVKLVLWKVEYLLLRLVVLCFVVLVLRRVHFYVHRVLGLEVLGRGGGLLYRLGLVLVDVGEGGGEGAGVSFVVDVLLESLMSVQSCLGLSCFPCLLLPLNIHQPVSFSLFSHHFDLSFFFLLSFLSSDNSLSLLLDPDSFQTLSLFLLKSPLLGCDPFLLRNPSFFSQPEVFCFLRQSLSFIFLCYPLFLFFL